MTRTFSFAGGLFLVASALFVACGGDGDGDDADATAAPETTAETTADGSATQIPDPLRDTSGQTFRIVYEYAEVNATGAAVTVRDTLTNAPPLARRELVENGDPNTLQVVVQDESGTTACQAVDQTCVVYPREDGDALGNGLLAYDLDALFAAVKGEGATVTEAEGKTIAGLEARCVAVAGDAGASVWCFSKDEGILLSVGDDYAAVEYTTDVSNVDTSTPEGFTTTEGDQDGGG